MTWTLTDGRMVTLDEGLPLGPTRVRVVIEPLPAGGAVGPRSYGEVVGQIRRRQVQRGHRPPAREAVDAYLKAEREAWEG